MHDDNLKRVVPPFLQLDFQLTSRCNARCIFCNCWQTPSGQPEIPATVWLKTAAELKSFTEVEFVCLGGGEPFLYQDLFPLIAGLHDLNVKSVIVSNGSLIDDEAIARIGASGLDKLDLSLDAFAKTHDKMRRLDESFSTSVGVIEKLARLHPHVPLGISTLICADNLVSLPAFVKWATMNLPISSLNLQVYNRVVHYEGRYWWLNDPHWPKDPVRINSTFDELLAIREKNDILHNDPIQLEQFRSYLLDPERRLGISCPAGAFNFSVSSAGEVIPCIKRPQVGSILSDNPIELYLNHFEAAREKARSCFENCHFLINCYHPLHWKRWDKLVRPMVKNQVTRESRSDHYGQIPTIYLAGSTEQEHRSGEDLPLKHFEHQLGYLAFLIERKAIYHITIGVKPSNFDKLDRIYALICTMRGTKTNNLPRFSPSSAADRYRQFQDFLGELNESHAKEGIEYRIVDQGLEDFFLVNEDQPLRGAQP